MHRRPAGSGAPAEPGLARRWLAPGLMSAILVASLGAPAISLAAGNTPPLPGYDDVVTPEDTAVTGNVLANDTDADGDPLTVDSFTPLGADLGTLTVAENGDFTYTPVANWHGHTSTTYYVTDGFVPMLGFIAITVTSVNDDPVAVDDTVTVVEDTATDVSDAILANDTDIDGDTLGVASADGATGGEIAVDAGAATFTPEADACGPAEGTFDYVVSDGNGGTDAGHVTVDVTCVNDAPVAVDDTASVDQGSGAASYDVVANDTDVEDDALTLVSAHVDAAAGIASVVANKVRFTPLRSFNGEAVITYVVSDGKLTDEGTLTITVGPDITAPSAVAPAVTFGRGRVNETAPVAVAWSATDAGSGVASYELEVSVAGGAFSSVYSGAGHAITTYQPFGKVLVFRVRATDNESNVSDWVEGAGRTVAVYQAPGNSHIRYRGTWTTLHRTAASGDAYRYTTTSGRYAKLTFSGYSVEYVAPRLTSGGYVKVYIDGRLVGRYNLHRSSTAYGQIIVRKTWSTTGIHSIKVVNAQAGRRTTLDAFLVLKATPLPVK